MHMRLLASRRFVLKGIFYRGRETKSPLGQSDAVVSCCREMCPAEENKMDLCFTSVCWVTEKRN